MKLSNLVATTTRSHKRVGRGIGSGKGGHTSSRGQKGQKSRSKIPLTFEGTKIKKSLLKRLPVLRGKGKFKPLRTRYQEINLSDLNRLPAKATVTLDLLKSHGLVDPRTTRVKLLSSGSLTTPLTIAIPLSAQARLAIEKAQGTVTS